MAHFAYVVDGVVERVHVVANDVITDGDGVEQEALGQEFLSNLHGLPSENFIQCSYNGSIRGNYPGQGFSYDSDLDAFISPSPFPSWVLNDAFQWEAPVPLPADASLTENDDGVVYGWDEEAGAWIEA